MVVFPAIGPREFEAVAFISVGSGPASASLTHRGWGLLLLLFFFGAKLVESSIFLSPGLLRLLDLPLTLALPHVSCWELLGLSVQVSHLLSLL